jgi:pseudouridine-5'-phosphate glycosidase
MIAVHRSDEVAAALAAGGAVVALESSVICQGLPPPHHLEAARRCEAAVRAQGAVPATIALLDGQLRVGLTTEELERLAGAKGARKLASRDLAVGALAGATGGTTVSATLLLAEQAGIRVFATGGIGGVHRDAPEDVSADLYALARHRVAVVCAGAKSILDLPRTLELLETLSVPVLGLRTSLFPEFYATPGVLPLEHTVEDEGQLAGILAAHWALGAGGALVVQPCPVAQALPRAEVEAAVESALAAAKTQGVQGKAVTPFLLGRVSAATHGRSLQANLALLEHNAQTAGRLAVALARR